MNPDSIAIVDCHVHFVDAHALTYQIFQQRNASLEAIVCDYSRLPRRYLPEDYLQDSSGFNVAKIVCAEFMSDDPIGEVKWALALSNERGYPQGMIAQADFLRPDVASVIDSYGSIPRVRAVRQHLALDPQADPKQLAAQPDVLADAVRRERLALLREYGMRCEIEIRAPQLPGFAAAARSYPDMQFILPMMGWPIDVTNAGYSEWKRDMKMLSGCNNVAVKIFGMECIFGLKWTVDQVRPWILDTIEFFGPQRCMFASHMPIAKLSRSFQDVYAAYFDVVSDFSASDKQMLFHDTASAIYGV